MLKADLRELVEILEFGLRMSVIAPCGPRGCVSDEPEFWDSFYRRLCVAFGTSWRVDIYGRLGL